MADLTWDVGREYRAQRLFSQADFEAFAALSGDDNPIHVDADFAARTPFGRPVAHGMFLYGHVCAALRALLPGAVQVQQQLMFPNPTFADEEVTIGLTLTAVRPDGLAQIEATLTRPDGQAGLVGATLAAKRPLSPEAAQAAASAPPQVESEAAAYGGLMVGRRAQKTAVFDAAAVAEYARLTGDAGAGDGAVPPGLLGGMISDLLGTRLPGRGTNWLKQRFAFLRPARLGERITAVVQISRLRPQKGLVNLLTTCCGENGRVVCTGEALVLAAEQRRPGKVS